jgi:hypothetical protein
MPLAAILIALALIATGAAVAMSSHDRALAAAAPVSSQGQAPTPRNLTFYMHNNTLAKTFNGVSTSFLFDTLQKFGRNNTASNLGRVRQDWYLFPALAGNLSLNGTISLHVFVSVTGATLSVTPTVSVSEINGTGATIWTTSSTAGARQWFTVPHDLVVTTPAIRHTFAAGSTILVLADVVVGASDLVAIWYNASWVPTQVIFQSDSFAQVGSLAFLDPSGMPRVNFDPLAANKTITIRADVTDPLGGYDIAWANLTLQRPGGGIVLNALPMAKTAGTPLSYVSTYKLTWNYSGQPAGPYNATASVLDNSGLYYFRQFFATGPFLAQLKGSFYIGGLPVYVNVEAVDSKSAALAGASVTLLSGGVAIVARTTDANGIANFTMARGTYTFRVVWEGVQVASMGYSASANVSAASPLPIICQVYYPTFQAQDANGAALADASLVLVTPSGQEIGPYKTDSAGDVNLTQVPVGAYGVKASWRGVNVYSGTATVSSNGVIAFQTAVYQLTVTVQSQAGQPLSGAFVSVVDSRGLVFDAGDTGSDGRVVLRLPAGTYTIDYRYIATVDGTSYDSGIQTSAVTLTQSQAVTVTVSGFPIAFTSTLEFAFVLLYAITVAALIVVLFLMYRKLKGGRSAPATSELEKPERGGGES